MELLGNENFKGDYPKVTIPTESLENYIKLPWNDPKEFQTEFDKKSKEFHEKSKRTAKTANDQEREYLNLRAIDVLWKPFDYQVATRTSGNVGAKFEDDLKPAKIEEIFKETKLVREGEPVTALKFFNCQTSELSEELSYFVKSTNLLPPYHISS